MSDLARFQETPDVMIRQVAKPEFLQRLGVFVLRDFLPPNRCAQLYAEMQAASHERGTVGHQETVKGTGTVDETVRKVLLTGLLASSLSVAVQVTVVVPMAKVEPEAWSQLTVADEESPLASVAVGGV